MSPKPATSTTGELVGDPFVESGRQSRQLQPSRPLTALHWLVGIIMCCSRRCSRVRCRQPPIWRRRRLWYRRCACDLVATHAAVPLHHVALEQAASRGQLVSSAAPHRYRSGVKARRTFNGYWVAEALTLRTVGHAPPVSVAQTIARKRDSASDASAAISHRGPQSRISERFGSRCACPATRRTTRQTWSTTPRRSVSSTLRRMSL